MVNAQTVVSIWSATGRTFTAARNVGIARLFVDEAFKSQKELAVAVGVDQGDVSRIVKVTKALSTAQRTALKKLAWPAEGKETDTASVTPWVKLYDSAFDTVKAGRAKAEPKSAEAKFRDALQTAFDTLVANPEQDAAWLALVADLFTPEQIESARANSEEEVAA